MIYPLVTDLADEDIPVALTCRVLGFSKQAYYKWRANPVSQRDWDDAHLINAALDIHHDDPEFGYRFITDELAERGVNAGRTGSTLRDAQLVGSMGRVGACADSAAMETSSACCRRTSWIVAGGPPATNCVTRSSSGSNARTIAGADRTASAG